MISWGSIRYVGGLSPKEMVGPRVKFSPPEIDNYGYLNNRVKIIDNVDNDVGLFIVPFTNDPKIQKILKKLFRNFVNIDFYKKNEKKVLKLEDKKNQSFFMRILKKYSISSPSYSRTIFSHSIITFEAVKGKKLDDGPYKGCYKCGSLSETSKINKERLSFIFGKISIREINQNDFMDISGSLLRGFLPASYGLVNAKTSLHSIITNREVNVKKRFRKIGKHLNIINKPLTADFSNG